MNPAGTILITGANRGIGLGLARQFLARGWRVIATCRRVETTGELADLARAHPDRCVVTAVEVRDAVSVAALAAALGAQSLDVLVNNAGINPEPRDLGVDRVAPEKVAEALDTNLLGALRVLQAAVPALRRGARPRIVNISSGAGSLAHNSAKQPLPAYCISKAALNMLTRCAARDLPGITVVSVSPGWIRTDMGGAGAELGPDEATAALATTIENLHPQHSGQWLDRFGQPSAFAW
jgi:NAD(P)-dependent dehydrogenase (short-subunit alcohol dehydrogenase family)